MRRHTVFSARCRLLEFHRRRTEEDRKERLASPITQALSLRSAESPSRLLRPKWKRSRATLDSSRRRPARCARGASVKSGRTGLAQRERLRPRVEVAEECAPSRGCSGSRWAGRAQEYTGVVQAEPSLVAERSDFLGHEPVATAASSSASMSTSKSSGLERAHRRRFRITAGDRQARATCASRPAISAACRANYVQLRRTKQIFVAMVWCPCAAAVPQQPERLAP